MLIDRELLPRFCREVECGLAARHLLPIDWLVIDELLQIVIFEVCIIVAIIVRPVWACLVRSLLWS